MLWLIGVCASLKNKLHRHKITIIMEMAMHGRRKVKKKKAKKKQMIYIHILENNPLQPVVS